MKFCGVGVNTSACGRQCSHNQHSRDRRALQRSSDSMSAKNWTTQDYIYVTAECVTGALSTVGNSLVLMAIGKTRALQTITNCFIGSLAAADVLVGLVLPPTVIMVYLGLPNDFHGCVLSNTAVVLITNISILNLLAVALERYLAISDPFRYERVMTMRRAMVVVAITWIVAILIGLVPTFGWNKGEEGFDGCAFVEVIKMDYMIYFVFFGVNLPPLFFMLVIYLYIFHIIRKQQRAVAHLMVLSGDQKKDMRKQKREVRGAKGLAYVIVLFAVCWMPIHILNCISFFTPENSAPPQWLLAAIVLSHANSFLNPFLYAFSNSKFKQAMLKIMCFGHCKACYTSDLDESSRFGSSVPAISAHSDRTGSKSYGNVPYAFNDTVSRGTYQQSSHSAGVLDNNCTGVVNKAFNEGETNSSDEEDGRPCPCVSVSSNPSISSRKALRWDDTVTEIEVSYDGLAQNKRGSPPLSENFFITAKSKPVITTDDRSSSPHDTGRPNSKLWVTQSSLPPRPHVFPSRPSSPTPHQRLFEAGEQDSVNHEPPTIAPCQPLKMSDEVTSTGHSDCADVKKEDCELTTTQVVSIRL